MSVAGGRVQVVDEREFWRLVDRLSWMDGPPDSRAAGLTAELAASPAAEVVAFQTLFDAAAARLTSWRVRGAAHRVLGWCTDDAFGDFRAWVIGQGREVWARVAADPDSLAALPAVRRLAGRPVAGWADDEWPAWESLAYAADAAYDRVLGYRANIYAASREAVAGPPPATYADEPWDFDDPHEAARHLPKLTRLFPTGKGHPVAGMPLSPFADQLQPLVEPQPSQT
jgi:hypothetical protein